MKSSPVKKHEPLSISISSQLRASQAELWRWITSPATVKSEFPWWLSMSFPRAANDLSQTETPLGQPMFTCWLWFCWVIPLGRIQLTFIELRDGIGFVEQSPMTSMQLWRHERWLETEVSGADVSGPEVSRSDVSGVEVTLHDRLTFQPMLSIPIIRKLSHAVVAAQFKHRHSVLRDVFAG